MACTGSTIKDKPLVGAPLDTDCFLIQSGSAYQSVTVSALKDLFCCVDLTQFVDNGDGSTTWTLPGGTDTFTFVDCNLATCDIVLQNGTDTTIGNDRRTISFPDGTLGLGGLIMAKDPAQFSTFNFNSTNYGLWLEGFLTTLSGGNLSYINLNRSNIGQTYVHGQRIRLQTSAPDNAEFFATGIADFNFNDNVNFGRTDNSVSFMHKTLTGCTFISDPVVGNAPSETAMLEVQEDIAKSKAIYQGRDNLGNVVFEVKFDGVDYGIYLNGTQIH